LHVDREGFKELHVDLHSDRDVARLGYRHDALHITEWTIPPYFHAGHAEHVLLQIRGEQSWAVLLQHLLQWPWPNRELLGHAPISVGYAGSQPNRSVRWGYNQPKR